MSFFQKCIKIGAIILGTILIGMITYIILFVLIFLSDVLRSDNGPIILEDYYEENQEDDYYENMIYEDLDDLYYKDRTNQL